MNLRQDLLSWKICVVLLDERSGEGYVFAAL